MDPSLGDIRQASHEKLLSVRVIDRIVGSDEFGEYYSQCSGPDKKAAEQLIISGDKSGLEAWMASRRGELNYAALSIRELRPIGHKLGVRYYNQLSKSELLMGIENATKRLREEACTSPDEASTSIACSRDFAGTDQQVPARN